MDSNEAVKRIAEDLARLGVRPGGVLLVHSSLSSLGHVPGGAETVICGLLEALGLEGTLLMPALGTDGGDEPVFDVLRTATWTGRIPETFRTRAGTQRSVHPTHSVCGVGRLASEILGRHEEDRTPCGPHSPFHLLPEYNGQILMLGCGLRPNTSFHAIEELIEPTYLYGESRDCTLRFADGREVTRRYRMHGFAGWRQRYDRVEPLMAPRDLARGNVLAADAHLIAAPAMWQVALSALRREALFFVEEVAESGE